MDFLYDLFSFDNVGGKIKGLAKWACLIFIGLIWIACGILFLVLIFDEDTRLFSLIPIIVAVIVPLLLLIGSWTIYAFGEMAEKISDNERNTTEILTLLRKIESKKTVEVQALSASAERHFTSLNVEKEAKVQPQATEEKKPPEAAPIESSASVDRATCPHCKFVQPADRKICWNCGAKITDQ